MTTNVEAVYPGLKLRACRHTADKAIAGMTRIASTADHLYFRCAICLHETLMARCRGTVRDGQCMSAADLCANHGRLT